MDILFADRDDVQDTALALLLKEEANLSGSFAALPDPALVQLRHAAAAKRFVGKAGEAVEAFVDTGDGLRRVLLVGLGDGDHERGGATIAQHLMTSGETGVTVLVDTLDADAAADLALGIALRAWRFDRYRTELKETDQISLKRVVLVGAGDANASAWASRQAVLDGVHLTRSLVTEPGNVLYPQSFVDYCQHLAELGVELTVLDGDAIETLGMGALLGVARGSAKPPRVLAMRWDGTNGAVRSPVALVGKGVTFDSGGLSIKPAAGMDSMKWDMGGAAAVAGTMRALAGRKANAHVVGVCGLVENMPDGDAQRPGDIVTSMSGRTIEVLDTDCEGRMVLCDVLTWVQKTFAPHTIIDLATLTGSIMLALGHERAGLFANDDSLADQLLASAETSSEPLWRMPLGEEYDRLIDSDVADVKNLGPRAGGAITAAQFLKRFIETDVRWAHLDVAGVVWADKVGRLHGKGATGYGVRLLDRFIADHVELAR